LCALRRLGQLARRTHPVERLIGAVVGMDTHRTVGFDEKQPTGRRQVGGKPTEVVHPALGDHESHRFSLGAESATNRLTPP